MCNGTKVLPHRKARMNVTTVNRHVHVANFITVRDALTPHIWRKTAVLMRLITVDYSIVASVGEAGAEDST